MAKRFEKFLVLAVIFTMTIVNYGMPLQAIASEGESIFNFAFFRKNEISLDAHFGDDSEKQEDVLNVNDTAKITLEVSPLIEGYLKSGSLKFNLKNGNENNFRIQTVTVEEKEELELDSVDSLLLEGIEDSKESKKDDSQNIVSENKSIENKTDVSDSKSAENKTEESGNFFKDLLKNSTVETLTEDASSDESSNTVEESEVKEEADENNDFKDVISGEKEKLDSSVEEKDEEEKVEESVVDSDEEIQDEELDIEEIKGTYEVSLASENEIALKNIIDSTKIFVEVVYKQSDKINPEDLYSEIEVVLEGNYINKKLENVDITRKQELTLGWEYSKDVKVTSDFVKVSPFTVGEHFGTIIENIVTINRNVEESNYLPIKETSIKIEIPKINDKLPIAVNVSANKLMATIGKELTGREFTKDDWSFDKESGILEIKVTNDDLLTGKGEDKLDIICRYEDYIEDEKISLDKKLSVKIEEYSSNKNKIQEIKIDETQEKEVVAGELMSYAVVENEETIGKGKINANYNIDAGETRFSSTVNVTVLTSDILNEVVIEPIKETYKNEAEEEFDATSDVMYAGVRFNYAEIKDMLEQGSTIDLLDAEGNVFHTITKDVDATKIEFAHKIDSLKVRINNVKVNGNLSIEFSKSIEKSQYSFAEFTGFEKIENTYKSTVKYVGFEDVFQLPEVKDEIKFTNTVTQANLVMNVAHLSTIYENENVEFKIDLINNLETSDIYKNPSFELVFPTFVKEVKLNNIYTLYQNGLSIKNHQVVNENGVNKIIIDLEGVQNGFNFSNITNGTNIIINANLKVDEITPQKQDEIRLYFCNEAVTNYQTQANWSISKPIPEGILKDTNGYDASIFEYQAPSGMITINSITNYDGTGSTIKSFNQGEIIKTIAIKGETRIATMELSVLNNTGSDAENTVLLGRIPFKGNKDVESGNDLGSNVDTIMKTALIPDSVNSNNVTIYYSGNENADRDLNNNANGWTTSCTTPEAIKSFMIVVDGTLASGGILKFKYDFEIPANLGYEVKMIGSFGAFYNTLNSYQSVVADKVGLITEAGAKYEASMSVDIGDGAEIGEARFLKYTIKVKNTGSIDLKNVKIVNDKPKYAYYCSKTINSDQGNDGYELNYGSVQDIYTIEELKVGQTFEREIMMKTDSKPETIQEYVVGQENIHYDGENDKYYIINDKNETVYITELPNEYYIENYATVYVDDMVKGVTTNVVKNKLIDSNFDIETTVYKETGIIGSLISGTDFIYVIRVQNISGNKISNIEIEDQFAKELTYLGINQLTHQYENEYDKETNTVKFKIGDLENLETARFFVNCNISNMKNIGERNIENFITVTADDDIEEKSTIVKSTLVGPELHVTQELSLSSNTVKECEKFDYIVNVSNKGKYETNPMEFNIKVPSELKILQVSSDGNKPISYRTEGNVVTGTLFALGAYENASLIIKVMANPLNEGETNRYVKVDSQVSEQYIGKLGINELDIIILDDPNREMTEEEKKDVEKENTVENPTAGDEYRQDVEDVKNNATSNNTSPEEEKAPIVNNNQNNSNNNKSEQSQESDNNQQEESQESEEPVEDIKTYKISGQVFKDENKNNAKDNTEEGVNKVQVTLYNGTSKIGTMITDSLGKYRFTEIPNGDYIVVFDYDGDSYTASKYKNTNVAEDVNSDAIESEEGIAVTENIKINDSDIEIDLGLQDRNNFDMTVQKYISKAVVNTKGKEKVTNYDNDTLAKLEIRSKELANTTIQLEYRIVVTNTGNVNGTVGVVYDYLPDELTFDEKKNSGWKVEGNGVLYNESLNKEVIKPGESKELKLVLNKVMTNNNTGTISNKVEITNLSTDKSLDENSENNIATQEMIITVSTGRTISIMLMIVLIIMATVVIYGIKTGKIKKAYK